MSSSPKSTTTAPRTVADGDTGQDMVDRSMIFRYIDEPRYGDPDEAKPADDGDDTSRLPKILSAPEGIEVVEHAMGRATAQWILLVRCQCGRRWFELEPVKTATCARCGTMVLVQIEKDRGTG